MSEAPQLLTASPPPPSPARTRPAERAPVRVGLVQERWHPDPDEHQEALATGIRMAAGEGARVVCLQELTLSPYFAITPDGPRAAGATPEELDSGPTVTFARRLAMETGVHVHASLYERAEMPGDELGYNTAVVVAPDGRIVSRTRKLHIPVTAGYYEDRYFRPGPADGDPFPITPLPTPDGEARLGCPTCWDQWFPELARAYSLEGAEVLIYPTAIGSEPDHPDFDTQPLWQQVIVANGVANGTFMVAVNRIGFEDPLTFYGSSFISDPYGRVLVQAPRDRPAVLVGDLDLDQRRDWLELFPFLRTRRPDAYALLTQR
ncbi:MAG TPA: nitrilase-related carbon-nitrogen hydrolase [Solirubrobacteraceae bacterium]|jgi:N-carbamoylputrescine amidase|nr:nitrilase-related carbon-nitrogen hydrolase [Solirubrobacteraceae bacterium]